MLFIDNFYYDIFIYIYCKCTYVDFFSINMKSNLVISNSAKKTKSLSFDTSKCNNVFLGSI